MMKVYPSWFVFFTFLVMGIALISSGENWFIIWIGFELSLLGFIPMFSGNPTVIEGILKYFLTQAGGSSLFLMSFLVNGELSPIFFVSGMMMKLGLFPFFQWVPSVMTSLSWGGCFLLTTIQKVGPLTLLMMQSETTYPIALTAGALSILISGILGYNQSFMRALMGYSSISHTGWIVCATPFSTSFTILYFLLYSLTLYLLFSSFSNLKTLQINSGAPGSKEWLTVNTLMLTLSGIPPFLVFFMKVMILSFIAPLPSLWAPIILGTLLSIYYYLTFIIPSLTSFWDLQTPKSNKVKAMTTMLTALGATLAFAY